MYEGTDRARAEIQRRTPRPAGRLAERPDRVALWAVVMALVAMVAAAATAHAGSGGTGSGGSTSGCSDKRFGARSLKLGDCGDDVKTLNWILKSKTYSVPLHQDFNDPTDGSVRSFQRRHELNADGVVSDGTRKTLVHSMNKSLATWYGPGFFGSRTACGQTLHRDTIGVAHRSLPCGTKVTVAYHHRFVRARVIDRGPYSNGADWDLTQKTARKLNFSTTDDVRVAVIR
jgi:rare lipoprotein A (peptidoglycan hydrolase)